MSGHFAAGPGWPEGPYGSPLSHRFGKIVFSCKLLAIVGFWRISVSMVTIVRTTNAVRLSFLQALLSGAGIRSEVFDANMSALEAGIGAFPKRLAVPEPLRLAAENLLRDADEFYDD